jgi:hypothetical protein
MKGIVDFRNYQLGMPILYTVYPQRKINSITPLTLLWLSVCKLHSCRTGTVEQTWYGGSKRRRHKTAQGQPCQHISEWMAELIMISACCSGPYEHPCMSGKVQCTVLLLLLKIDAIDPNLIYVVSGLRCLSLLPTITRDRFGRWPVCCVSINSVLVLNHI